MAIPQTCLQPQLRGISAWLSLGRTLTQTEHLPMPRPSPRLHPDGHKKEKVIQSAGGEAKGRGFRQGSGVISVDLEG